jgi:Protein phosphatase 2C
VRQRTSDDKPVRVSRNEEWKGTKAIRRVAGSLAVTRAIGDAYLKLPQLRLVCCSSCSYHCLRRPRSVSWLVSTAESVTAIARRCLQQSSNHQDCAH